MKNNTYYWLSLLILIALPLGGCSGNVREQLGLEKDKPDEFAVLTRAPLEMPSTLTLPPPNLGAPRPQESTTIAEAKEAVFGKEAEKTENVSSTGEDVLLQKAGSQSIEPNIRAKVNKETAELVDRNKPVAEKLLNITGNNDVPSATIVDAKKELERLQQNKKEGKPVTEGDTPIIEE